MTVEDTRTITVRETINLSADYMTGVEWQAFLVFAKVADLSFGIYGGGALGTKAYWRFNISSIPSNATIEQIQFTYNVIFVAGAIGPVSPALKEESNNPETTNAQTLFITDETTYFTLTDALIALGAHTVTLNANAISDLSAALGSQNWFAIEGNDNNALVVIREFAKSGTLSVTYHYSYTIHIPCTIFMTYTEEFADAALAGTYSAAALNTLTSVVEGIDPNTFEKPTDAIKAKNVFLRQIYSSYDEINNDANAIAPMIESFRGLSTFLQKCSGQTVNEYLTTWGFKVNATYAAITEDSISSSNIEE